MRVDASGPSLVAPATGRENRAIGGAGGNGTGERCGLRVQRAPTPWIAFNQLNVQNSCTDA
jgi:hypothetical protein